MKTLLDNLKEYVDSFGLLTQSNSDGGDSMNFGGILFTVYKALGMKNDYVRENDPIELSITEVSEKLVNDDGRGRRHSDVSKWYGDFLRLSRDQYKTFLTALAVNGATDVILKMMKHHFLGTFKYKLFGLNLTIPRMGLFMHNTKKNFQYATKEEHLEKSTPDVKWDYSDKLPDFTGPIFWAIYIRVFFKYVMPVFGVLFFMSLYFGSTTLLFVSLLPIIILTLGDLQLLLDSYLNIRDKNDDTNHIIILAHVKLMDVQSPIAKLARSWYFEKGNYVESLDYHFRPKSNNPPFNNILIELIKQGKI